MSELGFAIFNVVINILETFLMIGFVTKYLGFQEKIVHRLRAFLITWGILFVQIQTINSLMDFEGILIFLTPAILCVYAFTVLQGKKLEKIFVSFIPLVCVAIISSSTIVLQSFIWEGHMDDMLTDRRYEYVIMVIFTKVVLVLAFACILKIRKTIKELPENRLWFLFVIIAISSIISVLFIYLTMTFVYQERIYLFYLLCAVAGILVMNMVTFYFLKRIGKETELKQEIELLQQNAFYQQENIRNILQEQERIKKMRHDMNSVILAIQGLAKQENAKEIYSCCKEYMGEMGQDSRAVYTGINTVDNLLAYKLGIAENQGNCVKVEIAPIQLKHINDIHMCMILGNLMDNAIEALQTVSDDNKCLSVIMEQDEESYISIFVKNTIETSVLESNPQFQTTKSEKEVHGFGVRNIKELVNQYDGMISFYEEDKMFVCHIEI